MPLDNKDIQNIVEANRAVFATKESLDDVSDRLLKEIIINREYLDKFKEELKISFSDLQGAVDAYAKKADTYFQEMVMLSHKADRHEKWL